MIPPGQVYENTVSAVSLLPRTVEFGTGPRDLHDFRLRWLRALNCPVQFMHSFVHSWIHRIADCPGVTLGRLPCQHCGAAPGYGRLGS